MPHAEGQRGTAGSVRRAGPLTSGVWTIPGRRGQELAARRKPGQVLGSPDPQQQTEPPARGATRAPGSERGDPAGRGAPGAGSEPRAPGLPGEQAQVGRLTCHQWIRLLVCLLVSCGRDCRRGQRVHSTASHVSARHVTSSAPALPAAARPRHAHSRLATPTPTPGPSGPAPATRSRAGEARARLRSGCRVCAALPGGSRPAPVAHSFALHLPSVSHPPTHSFVHSHALSPLPHLCTHARNCLAFTCSFTHSIPHYLIHPHSFIRTQPLIHSFAFHPLTHSLLAPLGRQAGGR